MCLKHLNPKRELRQLFKAGELSQSPKPPNYRKSGGLFKVTYPNVGAGKPTLTNNGLIRFPLGNQINRWFKVKEFFLPLPINLDFKKIKEFTILPRNGEFYLECSYDTEKVAVKLDINQALSIDLGTSWKASGKRTKRGLYRTKDRSLVNADLNGAANILSKVAGNLGINLSKLGRRCLTTVGRITLWKRRSDRKNPHAFTPGS